MQFSIRRAGRNVQIVIPAIAVSLAIDPNTLGTFGLEVQSRSERKECPVPDFLSDPAGQSYACAIDLRIVRRVVLRLIQPRANTFRGARQNRIFAKVHGVSAQIGYLGDCARSPLKSFVEEQVARKGYGNVSEYFRTLLREAQAREADAKLEALLLEGLGSGDAVLADKRFWKELRAEAARLMAEPAPRKRRP